MKNRCPSCGVKIEDDPKYCPACGMPLKLEPTYSPTKERTVKSDPDKTVKTELDDPVNNRGGFFGKIEGYGDTVEFSGISKPASKKKGGSAEKKEGYGDTVEFSGNAVPEPEKKEEKKAPAAGKGNRLSLYLSVIALALSVIAIVLVLVFNLFPSDAKDEPGNGDTAATSETDAPTQEPTEPAIAGVYTFSYVNSSKTDGNVLAKWMFGDKLEMNADYTGKMYSGDSEVGDVVLDKDSNNGTVRGLDCTYKFDSTVLKIDHLGMTLVYKKDS